MTRSGRLYLSPPDVGEAEIAAVTRAMRSGWVAPLGPDLDAFEAELAAFCGAEHAVMLSSGTAALHLGLLALGVGSGDEVVVPTLTFAATAFAVTYAGARPVLLDVEPQAWTLDPELLGTFLAKRAILDDLPAAIITVDVFGRSCDYQRILTVGEEFGVPVLSDAAEALGATYAGRRLGSFGRASVFSFNGNKIMTTSGGGALVTDDLELARLTRHRSTQARQPVPWYEHEEIGFNYRMSNVLAALGRVQLDRLPSTITRRRAIRDRYREAFAGAAGVTVMGDPAWGESNGWLTTILLDPDRYPGAPERVRRRLETHDIEARHIWKPMHRQPVFAQHECVVTGVADGVFGSGLCLPTGTAMTDADVERVASAVVQALRVG